MLNKEEHSGQTHAVRYSLLRLSVTKYWMKKLPYNVGHIVIRLETTRYSTFFERQCRSIFIPTKTSTEVNSSHHASRQPSTAG